MLTSTFGYFPLWFGLWTLHFSKTYTFAIFTLVKTLTFGTKKNPTKSTNDDDNNDAEIASDDHNEEFTYQEMLVQNAEKMC